MGLIIDNEPDLFAFAKNNVIIAGKVVETDAVITPRNPASFTYVIPNAQGGMQDGDYFQIVFPNYNFTGLSKTIKFLIKNSPSGILEIKSFSAFGQPLKNWTRYFLDSIFKIPFILNNYNYAISTSVPTEVKFTIGAKNKDVEYNFSIEISSPYFQPGNQSGVTATGNDELDNIYIACHLYTNNVLNGVDNLVLVNEKIASYKAFLDAENNFSFSINSDIQKKLQTYLAKQNDTKHLGTENFKYIIELKNRNNSLDKTGVTDNATDIIYQGEFVGILGGRAFYESISKDINLDYFTNVNRKFLTRRPKVVYLGETICINDFIINNDDTATNQLFATVQFTYEDGITEIMDIPNIMRVENKLAYIDFHFNDEFFSNIFLEKYPVSIKYQIKNLDRNEQTPAEELSGIFSETREIIFNRKYFRHNNYFRFYGSLGNSEFAWCNGKIEAESEASGIEFEKDLSHVKTFYGDEETIWKEFQFGKDDVKYNQKFKLNTGYKTKEEIQWLAELIGSELIFWYTKEQMSALVNSLNDQDFDDADLSYQVVMIDKQSIKYYDGDEELQAFSFEFKIAVESVAPHFTIKDNLKTLDIAKDVFVIDVIQAPLYRADFNPQVIFKIKNNYQIGDTILIDHKSLSSYIEIEIVAIGEPHVDNDPSSDNITFDLDVSKIALQLRHVLVKYGIIDLDPQNSEDYIYFQNRSVNLDSIISLSVQSNFVEKQFLNCNNIWKYILGGNAFAEINGFTFANGTNKIYLHEIMQANTIGTSTFYNLKYPNDLEAWIYCIANYFDTNPQLSLFENEIDNRGFIKIKYKAGGGLANSTAIMRGLLDKYIFITKQLD